LTAAGLAVRLVNRLWGTGALLLDAVASEERHEPS
jgi:hypothetical protein